MQWIVSGIPGMRNPLVRRVGGNDQSEYFELSLTLRQTPDGNAEGRVPLHVRLNAEDELVIQPVRQRVRELMARCTELKELRFFEAENAAAQAAATAEASQRRAELAESLTVKEDERAALLLEKRPGVGPRVVELDAAIKKDRAALTALKSEIPRGPLATEEAAARATVMADLAYLTQEELMTRENELRQELAVAESQALKQIGDILVRVLRLDGAYFKCALLRQQKNHTPFWDVLAEVKFEEPSEVPIAVAEPAAPASV